MEGKGKARPKATPGDVTPKEAASAKAVPRTTVPAKRAPAKAALAKDGLGAVAGGGPATPPPVPARRAEPIAAPAIAEMFARFQRREPAPTSELTSVNAFTLLVAVVLSAQATDASVNLATPALFALADTPEAMLALGEDRVRDLIRTIGLYRTKARNVVALSRRLVETYGGQVPRSREDLESLPGVGRKTANVVLNTAYGVAVIAVDTHLFRVSNRIPLALGKDPLAVELGLEAVIPDAYKTYAHHWLLLHGRYTCKARAPDCPTCLIADLCRWPDKRVVP